ncbi:MAG TPA: site-specific DNA-methyltransferase [Acidobacteriota bacterium]|nr:site-specific DNA-methyltransferase [Acidobacteriota bacterium]
MERRQRRRNEHGGQGDADRLLPYCRLRAGEIWHDPQGHHTVGCGDGGDAGFIRKLARGHPKARLAVQDPPYNLALGPRRTVAEYIRFCRRWVANTRRALDDNAALYVWVGADQKNHFQPLPRFMDMMARTDFVSRSLVTMRNQRGYGTAGNWMAVRQELLYYTLGEPEFHVQYTDIPKILRGYYKTVDGRMRENLERSKSRTIRPGNVWVDIQQVFYRMEENVPGCPAQKPLKAVERILLASSSEGDAVVDFFSHAGTTLLAGERTGRRCITCDIDPVYAEITIRRLERFRQTGKTGWQREDPFAREIAAACAQSGPRRDRVETV